MRDSQRLGKTRIPFRHFSLFLSFFDYSFWFARPKSSAKFQYPPQIHIFAQSKIAWRTSRFTFKWIITNAMPMWNDCDTDVANTRTHTTHIIPSRRDIMHTHTHWMAWKMANVKKPHNNIITYPTASHRWWCVPKYHRCYTQIMYIPYTNNIKLPSHVRNVLLCGEKCCTIIFTLRLPHSLTGWLLDCRWTVLAGCHSMRASPVFGSCTQADANAFGGLFIAALRCSLFIW